MSRSNSKKRSRNSRSKSPKVTKKRKVSKSKDSASSSDETTKRARPANQIIKSKINEGKQSQVVSIYGFGNNSLGQLGSDPDKTEKISEPTLIDRLDDVNCLDVGCGKDVNIIVESNNTPKYRKVIIFGTMETKKADKKEVKSESDSLGWEPSSMDIFDKQFIVQATAGESHCAVLTDEGDVYTWGMYNNKKGEKAGFKINRPQNETQEDPEKIKFDMFQDIVVQIASTPNRTLVLTQVGEVYEWGYTKMQNKVSARNANRSLIPQRVIVPEKVYALFCCAGEQIFALCDEDTVYAWGNNAHYQLGIDKYQPPPPPEDEKSKDKKTKKDKPEKQEKPKETEKKTKGKKGTSEKSSEGKKEGEEGEKEKKPTVPRIKKKKDNHIRPVAATLINALKIKIVKITGGITHTAILAKNGDVYIWGKNNYGQLGLGKKLEEEVAEPTKLGIDDVVDISCGAYHTAIVTKSGEVYAFGYTKDGRIPSDNETENEPIKIDTRKLKHKIIQVHCGKRHTLLIGVRKD